MRLAGGGGVGWWFLLSCFCLACCFLSVRSRLPLLCLLGSGFAWLAPVSGLVWSVSRRGLGVVGAVALGDIFRGRLYRFRVLLQLSCFSLIWFSFSDVCSMFSVVVFLVFVVSVFASRIFSEFSFRIVFG